MPLECTSLVSIQFWIKGPDKKEKQCTCPSSVIAFDMINLLMDVILHVLLFLINHHVFVAWLYYSIYTVYSSYISNNHVIILFCWNFCIVVLEGKQVHSG